MYPKPGERVYTLRKLERLVRRGVADEDVVEKILSRWGEGNTDDSFWHEYLTDDLWPQALEQIGFHGVKVYFSGFWSQGDGACFVCDHVDTEKLLTFMLTEHIVNDCIDFDGKEENFRSWLLHKAGYKIGDSVRIGSDFEKLLPLIENVHLSLRKISHHYSHSRTVTVDMEADLSDAEYELADGFRKFVDSFVEDLADQLYKDLEEEYEYCRDEKTCREQIAESDNVFTIEGELRHVQDVT